MSVVFHTKELSTNAFNRVVVRGQDVTPILKFILLSSKDSPAVVTAPVKVAPGNLAQVRN